MNTFTSEVYDSTGKVIAPDIETLSLAMKDLGYITINDTTASPFVDWSKASRNDPGQAESEIRQQIKSYNGSYWQHIAKSRVI